MSAQNTVRVGIYGGTFSPPHNGHLHAAKCFLEQMKLDELIVIPAGVPPHKTRTEQTSAEDRLELCRAAFSFSDKIYVSDMEIKREGKSYTADTLSLLTEEGKQLFLLCGTDMLMTLDRWYAPEAIFRLAHIVYLTREADEAVLKAMRRKAEEYRHAFGASVSELIVPPVPMSSSEVRSRIKEGKEWRDAVPAAVANIICEKGLYL